MQQNHIIMKRLITISLVLCVVSCQTELVPISQSVDDSARENVLNPNLRSIDEALSIAEEFIDELDSDMLEDSSNASFSSTKAFLPMRTVCSVQKIMDGSACLTKSSSKDESPLMYLVNYNDNMGFALMGADKRLPYVYAISNEGHLELSDTLENPGLAFVLDGIREHASNALAEVKSTPVYDSHSKSVLVTVDSKMPFFGNSDLVSWHQRAPYNKYCYTKDGKSAVVGCVAVACTQLMAHYGWPKEIDGVKYRWREMIKGSNDEMVARFMAKIGEPQYLNMNYGENSSSASVVNALKTFTAFGYTHSGELSYDEDKLIMALKGNKDDAPMKYGPIMSVGYYQNQDGSYSGHAWVIDAFIKKAIYMDRTPDNGEDNPDIFVGYAPLMVHCIWGWKTDGYNFNGYYYVSRNTPAFNLQFGPFDKNGNRMLDKDFSPTCYNKFLTIVADFYVNK